MTDLPRTLPEYDGGSLLNLVSTLSVWAGGPAHHATLRALAPAALAGATNVVLVLIDGLGDDWLARHGAGGALAARRIGAMTSVFPSTTASAITSTFTGRAPIEHGLTGWFTYLGEAGCVAAPLPFESRGDHAPLAVRGVAPAAVFAAGPLLDAMAVRTMVVSPRSIVDSVFNRHHCGRAERRGYLTLPEFVSAIEDAVKSDNARKFVYAYWPDYDAAAHRFGCEHRESRLRMAAFDEAFGALLYRLAGTGTCVVATADHGFVDTTPDTSLELADAPALEALLTRPLCGERRVAYCHVQPGRVDEFIARASDWLGERAFVRRSRDLVDAGWFGPGRPHPRLDERIGDVALVMNGTWTIKDWVPGETRHVHIGNHGGTSRAEMRVPLFAAAV